jgi:hypothetical protein
MSKREFQSQYTPAATADTTALANASHMTLGAGSATMILIVSSIVASGLASASAVNILQFARNSTLGVTPTGLAAPSSDGFRNNASQATTAVNTAYTAAGTPPQRSAVTTQPRLNLVHNAFGGRGIFQPNPGEEWWIIGQTASQSESSLSNFTGSTPGLIQANILYETL